MADEGIRRLLVIADDDERLRDRRMTFAPHCPATGCG
jgi:hypothetical protein